jgi:hypothetical protein
MKMQECVASRLAVLTAADFEQVELGQLITKQWSYSAAQVHL